MVHVWIEWLEPPSWKGKRQTWPERQIKGPKNPGAEVRISYHKKLYRATYIGLGQASKIGLPASAAAPPGELPGPSKLLRTGSSGESDSESDDEDDPSFESDSSSSSEENESLAAYRKTNHRDNGPIEDSENANHTEENVLSPDAEEHNAEAEPPRLDESDHEEMVPLGKRYRTKDPSKWNKNVQKRARQSGEVRKIPKEDRFEKRAPRKPGEHTKCRFKCSEFSEADRAKLCDDFWQMTDYNRQKDFILKHVRQTEVVRRRVHAGKPNKARKFASKAYFFNIGISQARVCQKFFLDTLCISNAFLKTSFKGKSDTGIFVEQDKRGRHAPKHKMTDEVKQIVKTHIESFPAVPSHYCRASSKRKYLNSQLSIAKMYNLYTQKCQEMNVRPVSKSSYHYIFGTDYNLAFFKPKKDQCEICSKYHDTPDDEVYKAHQDRKTQAQEAKKEAKVRACTDPSFMAITFDLQSVLQLPCSEVSLFYYKRKLCVYNLTIYELAENAEAHCYLWNECDGKRGSNEVGSCLYQYLEALSGAGKCSEISLFSDNCGGQNRNQFIAAMLLYAAKCLNFEVIEQNFLEPGHTQMEVDSMHSAIEHEKKNRDVYSMMQYIDVLTAARRKKPYKVHRMHHEQILDLKKLAQTLIQNRNKTDSGEVLNWLKVKSFRFEKANSNHIYFRYNFDEEFDTIKVTQQTTRGHPQLPKLSKAYEGQLPISAAKKKDLVDLCNKNLIPEEVQHWYRSLPDSHSVKDTAPEPGIDDGLDDIDE